MSLKNLNISTNHFINNQNYLNYSEFECNKSKIEFTDFEDNISYNSIEIYKLNNNYENSKNFDFKENDINLCSSEDKSCFNFSYSCSERILQRNLKKKPNKIQEKMFKKIKKIKYFWKGLSKSYKNIIKLNHVSKALNN